MCGIVGLFLKDEALEPQLGALVAPMLAAMSDRGPDSAGFAVYRRPQKDAVKLTVRGTRGTDWTAAARAVAAIDHDVRDTHAVLSIPEDRADAARATLEDEFADLTVLSVGRRMEVYKDVGRPDAVSARFGLAEIAGTHAVAHTRMATESAVTTDGAHPFSTGPDQCLVHNGSLSNHNVMRRQLARRGIEVETKNDSEVAAAYLTWRMREGDDLGTALTRALDDLDGFYTFVVGTEGGFGVLRDPIACKPAVMAETEQWVAFGSEYRALATLPGIGAARVWEPEPATPYFWSRAA